MNSTYMLGKCRWWNACMLLFRSVPACFTLFHLVWYYIPLKYTESINIQENNIFYRLIYLYFIPWFFVCLSLCVSLCICIILTYYGRYLPLFIFLFTVLPLSNYLSTLFLFLSFLYPLCLYPFWVHVVYVFSIFEMHHWNLSADPAVFPSICLCVSLYVFMRCLNLPSFIVIAFLSLSCVVLPVCFFILFSQQSLLWCNWLQLDPPWTPHPLTQFYPPR